MEFDEFARAQLPSVVRFAAALTGDTQLAQDLVQDAMVRAYLKWPRVSGTDRPDLYLRRMVVNGYLSWRRRWYQRTVRPIGEHDDGREPAVADQSGRIADRAQLAGLLAGLGRQQRAAIVLRFYEDRDDAEIAEVLGCATGTVRSSISRGLRTLRVRAHDEEQPPPQPFPTTPTTTEVSTP